jgi:hypothetical protein
MKPPPFCGHHFEAGAKKSIKYGLDGPNNKSVVNADEVCITIIGVDVGTQPEYLFSAIYGIMPPPRQWFAPGRNVEFFFADGDTPKFYHRDQFVKDGIQTFHQLRR